MREPATDQFQSLFAVAVERFEAGDYIQAEAALEDLLAGVPDHPQILNYLAVTVNLRGNHLRAEKLLIRAVEVDPNFIEAWNNLGLLSLEYGKSKVAANAFQKICKLNPDAADPLINLAHALHSGGLFQDAIRAYRRGLTIQPNHPSAWATFCRALLIEGEWREAVSAADHQLAIQPGHSVALALKSVAIQELGEDENWQKLVDFDSLIQPFNIEVPSGYLDLKTFNDTLSDFCQNHPSLEYTPNNKSTKLGFQTKNLSEESDSPITDLLKVIDKYAKLYRAERPVSTDHPFLNQQPNIWHYDIWATVLESGGHQDSHIHRDGWLSGVYYVQTPTSISKNQRDSDTAGWIEFGRPVVYPKAQATPVTRCYPPTEGCLYLFPSYFYHRTIPFLSETRRISIAFDLRHQSRKRQARFIDYVDG